MNVKLLLDENLSPWGAHALCTEDGLDACHIRDRGRLGIDDASVLDLAFGEDRILVTANVLDFVALARTRALHAGIILIEDGALTRSGQLPLIRRCVAAIQREGSLVNRVLWAHLDGVLSFEDIPPE